MFGHDFLVLTRNKRNIFILFNEKLEKAICNLNENEIVEKLCVILMLR